MYGTAVAGIAASECTVAEVKRRAGSHGDDLPLPVIGLRCQPTVERAVVQVNGHGSVIFNNQRTAKPDVVRERDARIVGLYCRAKLILRRNILCPSPLPESEKSEDEC